MNQVLVKNLHINRNGFKLSAKNFSIEAGEILGVMGTSGSGKSTLLQALAGFIPLQSGSVTVFGREIGQLPPEKRQVSLVFQRPWLFENRTVEENIAFGLRLQGHSKKDCEKTSQEWLQKMEIADLGKRRAWEISGGQAQRVALARAMAVRFPLLLLDEPFSALDSLLKRGLRDLTKHLVHESRCCAILVSHDWRDIKEVCDTVLVLSEGSPIAYDKTKDLKRNTHPIVQAICED